METNWIQTDYTVCFTSDMTADEHEELAKSLGDALWEALDAYRDRYGLANVACLIKGQQPVPINLTEGPPNFRDYLNEDGHTYD